MNWRVSRGYLWATVYGHVGAGHRSVRLHGFFSWRETFATPSSTRKLESYPVFLAFSAIFHCRQALWSPRCRATWRRLLFFCYKDPVINQRYAVKFLTEACQRCRDRWNFERGWSPTNDDNQQFLLQLNLKKIEEEFEIHCSFKIGFSMQTVIDSNASIIRSYNASLAS